MPYTILVVEDNPITRKMLRVTLATEGYTVVEAPDGQTALALMGEASPDLVLTDLILPDMDGFALVTQLRSRPGGADIPILACSGFLSRVEAARMSALGFTDFLMKPVEPSRLVRTVRSFLPLPRADPENPGKGRHVLIVDDDPVQLKLVRIHLGQVGFQVTTAPDGAEALEQARRTPPDAILSDVLMPRLDGFQLSLAVRQDPRLAHVPVVLVSANYLEEADRALARKVGATGLAVRTPDSKEAIDLLLTSLRDRPSQVRGPAAALEEEHVHRIIRQLERQVAQNTGLVQRSSFQAAVLSMLAALSSGLAQRLKVEMAPNEVLASLLDVGGLSLGVLYLHGPDGQLHLEAHHGHAAADIRHMENLCGHPELLQISRREGIPVTIPSALIPPPTANEFLSRAGVKSALVVPLGTRGEPIGALMLGSRLRDLDDSDWRPFAQTVGGQISQTIALSRAFARLTAAEEQYRALFEHALEGIHRSSPTGALLLANPALARILGYASPEDLVAAVGDLGAQVYVDPGRRAELLRQLEAQGVVAGFEARLRRKDGRLIWVSESARAVRDASGRLVYLEGRIEDISGRRQAEETLRESEERFRSAFEESAIGMALQAIDGRYLRVNRVLCEMLGYSAEELLGMTSHVIVHPEDQELDVARDARMLAGEIHSYETEKRYVHKLGHEVWVLASVSLVHDALRDPLYFVVQAQDITARKQAAAIQARLQAQLAQTEKLAAMGQLLAGVAHELNNPLSVVLGQASLLQKQVGEGPSGVRVGKIAQATERCARIVKNFLALARQRPPERTAVDVNQVVREAVELLAYPLRVDGVEVRLDLAANLPTLWADTDQLHQVLINLVSNAQQALRGSPPPRHLSISSRAEAEETRIVIEVADNGPGIPPDISSRIFEPFFTTKRVGEGTGLGLPLCRGIVEEHGGTLSLESRPGSGAVFRIELPRQAPRAADHTAVAAQPGPPVRERKILVVDDEVDVADVLAAMLETDKHRVETAKNGVEALDRINVAAFDAIICDLRMPELDGPDLYGEIERRHPALLGRFVFLTGDTLDARIAEFLSQTDAPTVNKPFSLEEVRAAIQRVLGPR